jgi:hypothetical protein
LEKPEKLLKVAGSPAAREYCSLAGPRRARMADVVAIGDERTLLAAALRLGAGDVPGWSAPERRLASRTDRSAGRELSRRDLAQLADAIGDGHDPLGEAFCLVRDRLRRRSLGQTFTPWPVAAGMTSWAAGQAVPARVVEPGAGSARFLLTAGRRWRHATLLGAEVDPVAAVLARANLAVAGLAGRSRVLLADYRTLDLPRSGGPTLFIGNPPYVRHHQIPAPWKDWLSAAAGRYGITASRLAGLHAHFFLATAGHAVPGDCGVFITAAEWLDVNYGSLVRELLLGPLGGQAVHLLDGSARPFADAASTAAIACFRPGTRPAALRLRLVGHPSGFRQLDGGTPVPRARLAGSARWGPLAAGGAGASRLPDGYTELGELCRVHRGQVTGANAVWVTARRTLPARFLFPSVTRARELFTAGAMLADAAALRLVIDLPAELETLPAGERTLIGRFLGEAARSGAADSYIARHRTPWWRVRLRAPAPILATYMARRPPAFVRNVAGARHLNIAHGLYPRAPMPAPLLDRLAAYLRTSVHIGAGGQGRSYAGGLAKFEPGEMERLPVPGPDLLAAIPGAAAPPPAP